MKRLPFTVVIVLILLAITVSPGALGLLSCDDNIVPSYLVVTIGQQPAGGYNVNSLTCKYTIAYGYRGSQVEDKWVNAEGKVAKPPSSIDLKVYWVNEHGGEYNLQTMRFGLGSNETQSGTFTTTNSAKPGLFFDKTFWVVFRYRDSDGTQQMESTKAVCKAM